MFLPSGAASRSVRELVACKREETDLPTPARVLHNPASTSWKPSTRYRLTRYPTDNFEISTPRMKERDQSGASLH